MVLAADPGQQYRFVSVDLPGLAAAGPEAAKLRDAFAVKAGDPVIAADVIAAGLSGFSPESVATLFRDW